MIEKRIACIFLPRFAMERWRRRHPTAVLDDIPFVLAREGPHGPVVSATNSVVEEHGVTIGARVVDMRALCPNLRVEEADPAGDAIALKQLALWAQRWCPWSAVDGTDGLVLDSTGSAHLFGGEAGMIADIRARLAHIGLSPRIAIAPTWGAAWGFSRFGASEVICPAFELNRRFDALPVRALRLNADTLLLLRRLGLKTVGAIRAIPRLSLARRFARTELPANPLLRLDQALGYLAEPINPLAEPVRFSSTLRLAEPIQDPTHHLPDLAKRLCSALIKQGHGLRSVCLTVYRTDGTLAQIRAATSAPTRDPDHLVWLLRDKVEALDPGFGFDLVYLDATVTEPIERAQTRLEGGEDHATALATLVDRLTTRLGVDAVTCTVLQESHIPERSELWVTALGHDALAEPVKNVQPLPRPCRMLVPPEEITVLYAVPEGPPAQFIWRRQTHRVRRHDGPERIAPEWWRDRSDTRLRDYYKVEVQSGARYWIYRDGVIGDGRGETPRWYLQGLFS